jgi:hypothetical protein
MKDNCKLKRSDPSEFAVSSDGQAQVGGKSTTRVDSRYQTTLAGGGYNKATKSTFRENCNLANNRMGRDDIDPVLWNTTREDSVVDRVH